MTDVTEWIVTKLKERMPIPWLTVFILMWVSFGVFVLFIPTALGTMEVALQDEGYIVASTSAPHLYVIATDLFYVFGIYILLSFAVETYYAAQIIWVKWIKPLGERK